MAVKEKACGVPGLRLTSPARRRIFCPGCHYGIVVRLLCEVIEELEIAGRTIGLAGVGCTFGPMPRSIDVDFVSCPHGRAPAMATAMKRIYPELTIFTVQGDGDLGAIGLGCFMNSLGIYLFYTSIYIFQDRGHGSFINPEPCFSGKSAT